MTEVRGYLDDFVVEYTYGGSEPRLLDWVFGETGRRVYLTGLDADASYQITGPARCALLPAVSAPPPPGKGCPSRVPCGCWWTPTAGCREDAVQTTLDTVETWLDPAEPFYMGWLGNGRPAEHARF